MRLDVPLSGLDLEIMQQHAPEVDATVFASLGSKNAVDAFVSEGSTAPDQVRRQIERWKNILGTDDG